MNKVVSFALAVLVAAGISGTTYHIDMNYKLEDFAKSQLQEINYENLRMSVEVYSQYPVVAEKLEGMTLETYIVKQCELTPTLRGYFASSNETSPEFYDSVRDINGQLTTTIFSMCDFMDEVEAMYPKVIIESKRENGGNK